MSRHRVQRFPLAGGWQRLQVLWQGQPLQLLQSPSGQLFWHHQRLQALAPGTAGETPPLSPQLRAPMAAWVRAVYVREGEVVEAGQSLFCLEAMKMRLELTAPQAGQVQQICVGEHAQVEAGAVLAVLSGLGAEP